MKKYIVSGLIALAFLVPSFSVAQNSDVDTSPDSSCATLSVNMRYRSRDTNTNGDVSTLQDFLQSKNYLNSEPTGYFGLLTQKAVKSFQSANGISPTGFVGPLTRARIKALDCPISTLEQFTPVPVPPTPIPTPVPTPSPMPGQYDDFAQCLSNRGAVFYGAFWSPFVTKTKELFGSSAKFLNYVECSTPDATGQTQICLDKKITSYPTWTFKDGSRIEGLPSYLLQQLSEKTSCSLPPIPPTPPPIPILKISSISPSSGPVGTQVTIYGSGFAKNSSCSGTYCTSLYAQPNTINFGGSVIPDIYSPDGTSLTFSVPAEIIPACRYSNPPCSFPQKQITPGTYKVYVTNANGTSNVVSFKVMETTSPPTPIPPPPLPIQQIAVLAPSGGQIIRGAKTIIDWKHTAALDHEFGINLLKTDGSLAEHVKLCGTSSNKTQEPGRLYYSWEAGKNTSGEDIPNGKYGILIYDCAGVTVSGYSQSPFELISSPNNPPKITSVTPAPTNPQVGQKVSFTWYASDADNDDLRWGINWGDRTVSFPPCQLPNPKNKQNWSYTDSHVYQKAGNYLIQASVDDCQDNSGDNRAFYLNIGEAPSDLSITTGSLKSATVGSSYSASISGTGGSDAYKWSISRGNLPYRLSLTVTPCMTSPCKPSAYIYGTPNAPGSFTFTVDLVSGSQKTSKEFTIPVITYDPPSPTPSVNLTVSSGSTTTGSFITVAAGSTITITGTPKNIDGLSYYYGAGYPTAGYYNRAFFFDPLFYNSCSNGTEWIMQCTAQTPGTGVFYIEIYANGQIYRSNKVTVSVVSASDTPSTGPVYSTNVLGVEKFVFTLPLKLGSRGNEVVELQKALNKLGFNSGAVDGIFGVQVEAALIQFQIAHFLPRDGVVGPQVRSILNQ